MPKKTKASTPSQLPAPVELIERRIYLIRGHKIMLDADLAELYQCQRSASVINILAEEIEQLKQPPRAPPKPPKRRIGFRSNENQ